MINADNLITTLEHSLRQFKTAQFRLAERLKRVEIEKYENEAADLKSEIAALEESALKTEDALKSLLTRAGESKIGIKSGLE